MKQPTNWATPCFQLGRYELVIGPQRTFCIQKWAHILWPVYNPSGPCPSSQEDLEILFTERLDPSHDSAASHMALFLRPAFFPLPKPISKSARMAMKSFSPSISEKRKLPILLFDVMDTLVRDPFYQDVPAFFGYFSFCSF